MLLMQRSEGVHRSFTHVKEMDGGRGAHHTYFTRLSMHI
jgi:hypothetical protein